MSFALIRGYNHRYSLNELWGQAFGDEPEFISDMYACGYLKPSDVFALTVDGRLVSALFLPEYRIRFGGGDRPIRLLSCVATDPSQQGKGYMSQLISRTLELIRSECCGVCVIPVSESLFSFYEKLGFKTAFYLSEQVFLPDGDVSATPFDLSVRDAESYYGAYLKKYGKDGCVYKTAERFLQAVTEYSHPSQPCEFGSYSGGCAFLQRRASEILVREWTGDSKDLADSLIARYRLPVRIQDFPSCGETMPLAMLCSFSDDLTSFAESSGLYLNCMYN